MTHFDILTQRYWAAKNQYDSLALRTAALARNEPDNPLLAMLEETLESSRQLIESIERTASEFGFVFDRSLAERLDTPA